MQQQTVMSSLGRLESLNIKSPTYVIEAVDLILGEAALSSASDIHLLPTATGLEVLYRIDGVLHLAGTLPKSLLPNVAARLKLLANMITYRTDIPQEGRILESSGDVEKRVSTFPTHYGEKVVIRMFGGFSQFRRLDDLGLPDEIATTLSALLNEASGAIMFTGPAGSGKTTTLYTCLRELSTASRGGRSLMTLEDPIEMLVPGVAQAQINLGAGLDLALGLRSMMRQDPEVIGVGEIRDLATAEVALQASLTGHLLLSTFHAGTAAGVIGRLAEMGIEPYVITSGIRAIVCQRLVRRLCTCAAQPKTRTSCWDWTSRAPESPSGAPDAAAPATAGASCSPRFSSRSTDGSGVPSAPMPTSAASRRWPPVLAWSGFPSAAAKPSRPG